MSLQAHKYQQSSGGQNSERYDRSLQQQIGGAAFLLRTLFFVFASPFGFLQRHPCVEEGSKVVRPHRQHQHLQAVFVFFSFVPLCLKGQAFEFWMLFGQ